MKINIKNNICPICNKTMLMVNDILQCEIIVYTQDMSFDMYNIPPPLSHIYIHRNFDFMERNIILDNILYSLVLNVETNISDSKIFLTGNSLPDFNLTLNHEIQDKFNEIEYYFKVMCMPDEDLQNKILNIINML